jgi:hypothetical protein
MDTTRHVIECHSSQATRGENAFDDVASSIDDSWLLPATS